MLLQMLKAESGNQILVNKLEVTETVWEATRGLLGRSVLEADQGMMIRNCRSVHTWFMRFAIDLVYLTESMVICKLVPVLMPWRFSACTKASSVLELSSGMIGKLNLSLGQVCLLDNHTNR